MQKLVFILISTLLIQFAQAQDTILKINGEQIIAKILEITPIEIKFKKINFLEGPTFIENKSEIKMIHYSNGVKEEFNETFKVKNATTIAESNADYYDGHPVAPINKIEVKGYRYRYNGKPINERHVNKILLKNGDKQVIQLVQEAKHAKKMQYIGFAAIPLGISTMAVLSYSFKTDLYGNLISTNYGLLAVSGILLCATIACPIADIAYTKKRKQYTKQAVNLYNQKF